MAGKGTKNNQQNTQGDAQTEQAVQTKPLDFDVRIHSIKPNESIKGTASVNINGAFAIRGVKIIEGSNGLFVSMPSYKVGNEYKDICFPITPECRKQLNDAVLGAYEQALTQSQNSMAKHQTYPAGMAQVKRPIYCLLNTHPFYLSMHPQQGTDQFVCHLMKARSFIQFGNQFQ